MDKKINQVNFFVLFFTLFVLFYVLLNSVFNGIIKYIKGEFMKIIVASFQCESNSKAKLHPTIEDFEYFKGQDIFKKLVVKEIFENAGFEVVPSVYAVALP